MESYSERPDSDNQTEMDSSIGWDLPTDNHMNSMHENRRGRPKAATISNLMIEGAKSQSAIKCKYCARVFPREKSLQAHLRIHTGERPYACNYPGCFRAFTQSGQLKTHLRLHTGEKPFVCSTEGCKYRFTHANRHCPNHPEATLVRCHSTILRPKILNPNYAVKINDWFNSIDEAKQTQDGPLKKKQRKDASLLNEETENNHITSPIKKPRQVSNSETKANTATILSNNSIQTVDCNYDINTGDCLNEQKIELPKKRWLRAAAQDQALIELNQSRPTVLMRASKENKDAVDSSSVCHNVKSSASVINYLKTVQFSPDSNFYTMSKSIDTCSHSEYYPGNSPNNRSTLSEPMGINHFDDVGYKLAEEQDILPALNDSLNISGISASDLVPSLCKSNFEISFCELETELQPIRLDEIHSTDKDTSYNDNCNVMVMDNSIYKSPEIELITLKPVPSPPLKRSDIQRETTPWASQTTHKFSSAYKKNLHSRFVNKIGNCSLNNGYVPSSDEPDFNLDNVISKALSEQIVSTNSDEAVDDDLAYPLPSVVHEPKPLDLTGDNNYFQL